MLATDPQIRPCPDSVTGRILTGRALLIANCMPARRPAAEDDDHGPAGLRRGGHRDRQGVEVSEMVIGDDQADSTDAIDATCADGHMERISGSGPWLTDQQQRVWRSYLSMWRMLNDRIERDMQQHGGMPLAYYLLLSMLSEAPDRQLRMNRLAEIVGFSQSRLSHAVSRLEVLGWIQREPDAADKRGQIAALTDAGYTRLVEVAPLHAETVRSIMFDPLASEQLEALESVCTAILQAEADRADSVCGTELQT